MAPATARRLEAAARAMGLDVLHPTHIDAHRWRYALAEGSLDAGCLWDGTLRLGVCGDWCHNSRVEGAFLSGMAAAGRVLGLPDRGAVEARALQGELF